MTTNGGFSVCTTATRAQLPSARVLCASIRRHHQDADITVLVVDETHGDASERDSSDARFVSPSAAGVPPDELGRLPMACSSSELVARLTPWLLRHLIHRGASAVVALGVDTEVFAPLDDILELATAHGLVLAPLADAPVPDDGREPTPAQVDAAGPFAPGFVALSAATAQLDWWQEGQLVPFPGHVLDDPGCAVSAWNLHARELRAAGDAYEVSGRPLRWFDFTGYSPERPHLLSVDFERPRVLLSANPALARLCDEHGARLRAAGYDTAEREYAYAMLPDGREVDARMRRMYVDARHEADRAGEPEPPSAFAPDGPDAFVAWVEEPVAPAPDPLVSRYLTRVWQEDGSVQDVFPSLAGEGAEEYLGWVRNAGRYDHDIPEWVLPSEDRVQELMKRRWRARPAGPRPRGVNLVGYVNAVLGVGEVARLMASTLDAARVPTAVVANRTTMSRQSLDFDSRRAGEAPYDVNLVCVNADHTPHLANELGPEFFAGRRSFGVWFWEVEDFPAEMTDAFALLDEVWVASDFVLEALAPVSPRPVRKFRLPVVVPSVPENVSRADLGLPADRFVFLFVYDFFSTAERKNPVGLIEAYSQAFGPDDSTVLVVKSINGDKRVADLERVRRAAEGRPDVIVRDEYLSSEHHSALLGLSDAYVSLHRSEGFGMDMAKAMGLGKPVIATGYSGNLEFMDDTTAYLVDYELEPVGPGCAPYPPDSRWARPRLDHAAELMRRVVARPEEAGERGRRAAARIRSDFALAAGAGELARVLDDARARGGGHASWRRFFMDGWRERRRQRANLPAGTVDWLPDGTPVDPTMRRLRREGGVSVPDPEVDLEGLYAWLDERAFPPQAPVVSRYLQRLWCDRRDLQSHFPDIDANPRSFLEWLVEHGHDDTDIPYRLLPTRDDLLDLERHEKRRARRERLTRAARSAGQRATGLVNRGR